MTTSRDFILNKQLLLHQYQAGYRVAVDSILVGAMVDRRADSILDMGAGVGAVSLVAGFFNRTATIHCIEKNNDYMLLLKKNLLTENNQLGGDKRFFLHHGDIHQPPTDPKNKLANELTNKKFQQILINPPFDQADTATAPPDELKKAAFVFATNDNIKKWWQVGLQWLQPDGRMSFIVRGNMETPMINFFASIDGCLTLQRVVTGGQTIRLLANFQKQPNASATPNISPTAHDASPIADALSPPNTSPTAHGASPTATAPLAPDNNNHTKLIWAEDFILQESIAGKIVYSDKAEAILRGKNPPPFPF